MRKQLRGVFKFLRRDKQKCVEFVDSIGVTKEKKSMNAQIKDVMNFWDANPCRSKLSKQEKQKRYFEEIESKRYNSEWHIPSIAKFDCFRDKDVLEIGCGIGTDGIQFAKNGARYVGTDLTPAAIKISRECFELFGIAGGFGVMNAESCPFSNESFDHIYSFGVIHHSPNTEAIVDEMYRVLRPGGTICVMVYNKSSINYYIEIMFLRKIFGFLLYPRFAPKFISKITGLEEWKLRNYREVLLTRLKKRNLSKQEWLSSNTDGADCPLSKVYNKNDVLKLFGNFKNVGTEVWYFDKSHWPFIGKILPKSVCRFLGRKWGWHRIVYGRKPI